MNKFAMIKMKNEQDREIMLIAQEECAEVTQAISKVFRFGMDSEHKGVTNREHLEEEVGDLLCMIDLMIANDLISEASVQKARAKKMFKLAEWSKIEGIIT